MKPLSLTLILIALTVLLAACSHQKQSTNTGSQTATIEQKVNIEKYVQKKFDNNKSAHFVSSSPANNSLSNSIIRQIVITFNFDLGTGSKIQVERDGEDVTTNQTVISEDSLSMSIPINGTETGNYRVTYTACWPDGSCHNGSFGFFIKLP